MPLSLRARCNNDFLINRNNFLLKMNWDEPLAKEKDSLFQKLIIRLYFEHNMSSFVFLGQHVRYLEPGIKIESGHTYNPESEMLKKLQFTDEKNSNIAIIGNLGWYKVKLGDVESSFKVNSNFGSLVKISFEYRRFNNAPSEFTLSDNQGVVKYDLKNLSFD